MVDIVLSTYNGASYLIEQMDSIINQTNTAWRLIIRDDGSTDATIGIINGYVQRFPDKIFLLCCILFKTEEPFAHTIVCIALSCFWN